MRQRHHLWALRNGDEVRDEANYFENVADEKADLGLLPLIQQLIKKGTRHWDPAMASDPVQARLLDIIGEKKEALKKPGRRRQKPPLPR